MSLIVPGVAEVMDKIVVGDPADPDTDLGPLITSAHRSTVADMGERSEIYRDEIFRTPPDRAAVFRRRRRDPAGQRHPVGTCGVGVDPRCVRAQRASRQIHAGCGWIDDHIPIISEMPHGGFGASGFGKDMSDYSLEEYVTIKHVRSDITGVADKAWHRTVFTQR